MEGSAFLTRKGKTPLSSLITTALLSLAVISGSVFGVARAQDSTTKVKPCIGELCPPKSPIGDMPAQTTQDAGQSQQVHAQDKSSAQMRLRKQKRVSFDRKQTAQRLAKRPPQRLVESPPQRQVEKPQARRLRRADDPFLESFN